ncbi:hypothetical protein Acor_57550 [Acrocarpospora corrugata]|uniref:Uncharacterized protein n=1 Tax=Acrocarpospora corrugata TaxID=35763 RepID=A0A5M3W5W5_9ACTN|nr:hypothetical protein Acor_57550 [Acrocarpospora corrugata]
MPPLRNPPPIPSLRTQLITLNQSHPIKRLTERPRRKQPTHTRPKHNSMPTPHRTPPTTNNMTALLCTSPPKP